MSDHYQTALPGMPAKLFAATPSRLGTFTDCPRRYRMTYVDRPAPAKGPLFAHTALGSAVHAALKRWWDLPVARRTPEAAGTLLAGLWTGDGFRDAEQSERWLARASEWVSRYVTDLDPTREPVGVERQVATTTGVLALSGRADRIDDRDGELVIVDYKTGARPLDSDDARSSLPLACYAVGAKRTLRRECHRVELHHIRTGSVAAWTHTDQSLARHIERAENTARDIRAAVAANAAGDREAFGAVTGRHCGWCDFRAHCPAGRAAAEEREPWSLLGPDEPTPPEPNAGTGQNAGSVPAEPTA